MPQDTPRLPFEIDDTIDPTLVTGRAGVPLVIELFRQLGVAQAIDAEVAGQAAPARACRPSQLVESLIALWTSGGDRCQDLTTLREDQALGHAARAPAARRRPPSGTSSRPSTSRTGRCGRRARRRRFPWSPRPWRASAPPIARWWPASSAGPGRRRRPSTWTPRSWRATRTRRPWPTTGRGATSRSSSSGPSRMSSSMTSSATAMCRPAAGTCASSNRPWPTCPSGITQIRVRADSALYETDGPPLVRGQQKIEYAISADLSEQLKAEIRPPPRDRLAGRAGGAGRDPRLGRGRRTSRDDGDHRKDRPCVRRYLAVRVQKRQGSLFADGSSVHYFAVVTNRTEDGLTILQWHRRESGDRRARPSRPQERTRGRRAPQREVRGERRLVPAERPHVQPAHRAQAVDLTRRSPDRPAEAAPVPALQHRREGRRACAPDAPAALGRPPACLASSGSGARSLRLAPA